ncbi:MAG: LamG-like jellyroll fold domain-containing protein, partial [Bdellovibrionales bacterium]
DKGSGQVNTTISTATGYADAQWHHVLVSVDRDLDGAKIYVDGSLVASDTTGLPWLSLSNINGRLRIGGSSWVNSGNTVCNAAQGFTGVPAGFNGATNINYATFDGALDEFRYHRDLAAALTTTDVNRRFNARRCRSTTTLTNGVFYNIAASYNSTTRTAKLFVNGTKQCEMTYPVGTSIVPSQAMSVGSGIRNGVRNFWWNGAMSDFKVYNDSKSESDVSDIYLGTAPRHP